VGYIDTSNMPLHMPVPGSREPAQIALLNENCVVIDAHDHTTGKGLAMGRMRSGLNANRPAAGSAGNVYFATDTGRFYVDTGTAWVGFITEGGSATVTGWTLVDPVIRDTLSFGPEGSGTIDATLARTGAGALRVDTLLGVGVNPAAWRSDLRALQVGQVTALMDDGVAGAYFASNTYWDAAGNKALKAGDGAILLLGAGALSYSTAPPVAAGAAQTFTTRLALAQTGELTNSLAGGAIVTTGPGNGTNARLGSSASGSALELYGTSVLPFSNGGIPLGVAGWPWSAVYTTSGTVQPSSAAVKEDITPLDPVACYEAAKAVRWYDFRYQPPVYTEPEPPPDIAYDASDSNEVKAEKKVLRDAFLDESGATHARMVVETAPARHQRGFVFAPVGEAKDDLGETLAPVPDLFGLDDRESTTPQADLATLGCAMQEIIRRLEALEASGATSA
jgi:hypothetical protein